MNSIYRTQEDDIRAHLEAGKDISPAQAMLVYRISRLSSVIERLRKSGMDIVTVMKVDERGAQYGVYKLAPPIRIGSTVTVKRGHGVGLPKWVRKTKGSRVVGLMQDVAYVEFIRGVLIKTIPMNVKELDCVA